jgi:hypothetical protein
LDRFVVEREEVRAVQPRERETYRHAGQEKPNA